LKSKKVQNWLLLLAAIIFEVIATTSLKLSDGFTRLWPSIFVVAGYGGAFYLLSLILQTIPVGIVYAVWSGVGIALITLMGWFFFGQALDKPALLGIGLIVAGVIVLNLFSKTASH
jgi:small multidrug resistance pump